MSTDQHEIHPDVRAAIRAFLNERSDTGHSFSVTQAIDAIRRVFPTLELSDAELVDALTSEASVAGVDYDNDIEPRGLSDERKSLERWESEGGAAGISKRQ